MAAHMTQETFLQKALEVCGDKYTYDKAVYVRSSQKLIVTCRKHGDFLISSGNLFFGKGCPTCANERRHIAKVATAANKFKGRATEVHKGKYSYEKSVYMAAKKPIIVTCPLHGDFVTEPDRHLRGSGCQKCAEEARSAAKRMSQDEFISIASRLHNGAYDYSEVAYIGSTDKVKITCPVHGAFWQMPNSHLQGTGCESCGRETTAEKLSIGFDEFSRRANHTHNNKYLYRKDTYTQLNEKTTITCKTHGDFLQQANSHIRGCGCPECAKSVSGPEAELAALLTAHNIKIIKRDRKLLTPLTDTYNSNQIKEIDLVLPDLHLAIEYCGVLWHSEKYRPNRNYHLEKLELCLAKGYRLITIFEDEYVYRKDQTVALLSKIVGISKAEKIPARKCIVRKVSSEEANKLIAAVHLQGPTKAMYYYGLYYGEVMVACASFSKHRVFIGGASDPDTVELVRFCTPYQYSVMGGLGKLVSYAKKDLAAKEVQSYVDRRWFTGQSYLDNGFELVSKTAPNYWYIKGRKRLSRYNFAKHRLEDKYKNGELAFYDPALSEAQIMELNGYLKIYDCGSLKMLHK
jgi:hypothetical protein